MPRALTHELAITARVIARAVRRRLAGEIPAPVGDREFRATLEPWLAALSPDIASHAFLRIGPRQPWLDTGWNLEPGDSVTLLAAGRVYFSRIADIWVGPSLRLWCRVGEDGPVFRSTRDTLTFTSASAGRLALASRFPGEWADPAGHRQATAPEFDRASGDLSVLAVRWARGTDAHSVFRRFGKEVRVPGLVLAEAERLDQPVPPPPRWQYDWRTGASETFRSAIAPDGRPGIDCCTHGDVGILQRDARAPLAPGTRLRWDWRVQEIPSDLAEDTLPSHDYVSIAVEFDDGQDITYFWSAALPEGTVFRCPLPVWRDIESHVVVRSGSRDLGRWLTEERDLYADYQRIVRGPAREVVRVWLIGESLLQRGHGRCEYASIRLQTNEGTLEVL
ncbi:MAG: DUF3047 domain-containing protein [Gammaproteobacteria bacterium]|nr:DUF3047 domain-containing protein [Gammaproteobacteria bacterium]